PRSTLFPYTTLFRSESLLLVRAVASPWLRRYPFFFAYASSVFIQEVFLLVIYLFKFKYYASFYWYGEFTSVLLGCGVSWEIFRLDRKSTRLNSSHSQ